VRRALSTREPFFPRWRRRAITIPGYFTLAAICLALLPLLLSLALAVDGLRGAGRFPLARTVLLLTWYLSLETLGLLAAGALWLARPLLAVERYERANFRLQCGWARLLFAGACRLFAMRVEAAGEEALAPGPILLLLRHASVADTLLPAVLVSDRTGRRLRYVMKRELLWDPCLDVVGQRLPNAFVRRGTGDAAETARVRELARGLGPDEGVLLYPEGTRWTPARRRAVIDRLARSAEPKLLERAQALQWLLPPRLGGVLALLESAPEADVVIGVHTGFEGVRSLADVWNGALIGRRIRVRFERIAAGAVPVERDARVAWIFDQWERLDAWLEANVDPAVAAGARS
jgi:1-acyl-sn-glycerol-3-phosphate acyltransferase